MAFLWTASADGRQAKRPQRAPGASLSERSELGCDSERRSRSSPSASALTFWLLLGQAKSDTSDLIRRLRIGTAPFLYRRPEYRHLEQRSLLAQQRVASCPVQYGIGRRESRHDSPYMRSLDLGGGRYPLLRDEAVIDGSEPSSSTNKIDNQIVTGFTPRNTP